MGIFFIDTTNILNMCSFKCWYYSTVLNKSNDWNADSLGQSLWLKNAENVRHLWVLLLFVCNMWKNVVLIMSSWQKCTVLKVVIGVLCLVFPTLLCNLHKSTRLDCKWPSDSACSGSVRKLWHFILKQSGIISALSRTVCSYRSTNVLGHSSDVCMVVLHKISKEKC